MTSMKRITCFLLAAALGFATAPAASFAKGASSGGGRAVSIPRGPSVPSIKSAPVPATTPKASGPSVPSVPATGKQTGGPKTPEEGKPSTGGARAPVVTGGGAGQPDRDRKDQTSGGG